MTGAEFTGLPGEKVRAVESGVEPSAWRRVHWVTPILSSWQLIVVSVAALVLQNLEHLHRLFSSPSGSLTRALLLVSGGIIVIAALIGGYSFLAWRATSFAITDQAVWLRVGVLFRNQKHVRLERIQSVDLVHPLLGRLFGLGQLSVDSAGSGGSLRIGYLKSGELSALRAEIMARAAGVFRDANQDLLEEEAEEPMSSAPLEAPENILYTVPSGRLVGSVFLSSTTVWALVLMIALGAGIAFAAWVGVLGGLEVLLGIGAVLVPLFLVGILPGWSHFASEFDFKAAVSPDGIRIHRGLLETRSETIPPRRVHAVQVSQPLLWRLPDWYRVSFSQATHHVAADDKNASFGVLLPVGSRRQAMLALWLVVPDLGVDDVQGFFESAMKDSGRTPGFTSVPTRAWLFDLFTFRRLALALTRTAMVVRGGFLTRTMSAVPYSRIQSLVVRQGPLDHALKLAGLQAGTVPGPFTVEVDHLDCQEVADARDILTVKAEESRVGEPPERWFARAQKTPTGSPERSREPDDSRFKP